ncbi:MAG: rRNA adenine N-6-methyltransferase family protein [Acidimicrobiales bacterium]
MSAIRGPRWGWHQLDSRWARRVVADAGVVPGDLVLDVGAGTGAITRALAAVGASVIAIELHPQRAAYLRNQFNRCDVTVVGADASDLRLPRRPFKVVSNPPFGITTSLVKRLVSPGSRLIRADLVVPRHAAQRWNSPDAPGRGRWGSDFVVHLGRPPPRSAFHPPPPKDVALLVVVRRGPSQLS